MIENIALCYYCCDMNTKPPSRMADQFVVRLPDGMRERIAEQAKQNGRSMNAEIVARLDQSFSSGDQTALVATIARLTADLARAEFESYTSEMRAAGMARRLIITTDHLRKLAGDNPEIRRIALLFAEYAEPFNDSIDRLDAEFDTRVKALSEAISEAKKFQQQPTSQMVDAELDDGATLLQAKEVKAPQHDLPKPSAEPPKRRLKLDRAQDSGEVSKPATKKSTKS